MATLPAPGYLSDAARTVLQEQVAVEAQRDVIAQLPGGSAEATLTIASGSVTPGSEDSGRAKAVYAIDTEAAAATDDLTNVDQTNLPDGSLLLIRGANAARVVTAKHSAGGAGQLALIGAVDRVLGTTTWLLLKRTGTVWDEILAHGPAGGDLTGTYPSPTIAALAVTDAKVAAANKDGAAATPSLRTLGTGAAQACAGNDTRLSDARTPTAHKDSHKSGGSDALLSSDLIEAIVKRLQESGGPTTLTLGAVADGKYFKRSGATVVGDTPAALDAAGANALGLVRVLDRDVTAADVTNTVTETQAYGFTVPGGTLGTTRALRLSLIGDVLNNSGGPALLTVRMKFGATTIYMSNTISLGTNASRRGLVVDLLLVAANSAAAQVARGGVRIASNGTAGGDSSSNNTPIFYDTVVHNSIAENSAVDKNLQVTFQWEAATTDRSARALAVTLELLP